MPYCEKLKLIRYFLFYYLINLSCCQQKTESKPFLYDGPISMMSKVYLVNSDSAMIRTILIAEKQMEFSDGNMEFPEGIEIRFLNTNGDLESKLTANKGFYNKKENLYFGKGNVNVENFEKNQKLISEELYWNSNQKKIYSNVSVEIRDNKRIIKGIGFESNETFSNYKVYKSSGEIPLPGD